MRRFNFVVSCALASLIFFGEVATGRQNPTTSGIIPDIEFIPQAEAETAPTTENAKRREPDNLSAAVLVNNAIDKTSDSKKPTSLERAKAALAESSATAPSDQELCTALVDVARTNDLPLGFFTNLIWRESRFDHDAISPVGAMGIAQFMPDVAEKLSLDAFDSRTALPASGRLLRTLRTRFGNLGLAAAAYNAGPKRVSNWLERRSGLPKETQDYVHHVTGRPVGHWQNAKSQALVFQVPRHVPCHRSLRFAFVEQAERTQQEQMVADAARLAEKRIREAARRESADREKRKSVMRAARFRIGSRVYATKSIVRRPGTIQLAQFKR